VQEEALTSCSSYDPYRSHTVVACFSCHPVDGHFVDITDFLWSV